MVYRKRKALPPLFGTAPKGIHFDKVSASGRVKVNREDTDSKNNSILEIIC